MLTSTSPSGVLYNQFLSQADFEVLRDRAQVSFLRVNVITAGFLKVNKSDLSLHVDLSAVLVQGLGCLVWQDIAHRVMVVTPQGHSEVKRFWKRQRSQTWQEDDQQTPMSDQKPFSPVGLPLLTIIYLNNSDFLCFWKIEIFCFWNKMNEPWLTCQTHPVNGIVIFWCLTTRYHGTDAIRIH